MAKDLSFLPFFITEDLFILPEDRTAAVPPQAPAASDAYAPASAKKGPPAPAAAPPAAKASAATTSESTQAGTEKEAPLNPQLVFGKNLKQLLVLVEDAAHPVMERADGLLLKDILKAVGFSFDDVAIVNIAHCKQEADWQTINEIPFSRFFSFGVSTPKVPVTTTLAPYELEVSGDRKFLLTDKLSVLRSDRSRKIALWNLLKQIFV